MQILGESHRAKAFPFSLLATSILFVGLCARPSSAEGRAGTEEGDRATGSSDAKPRAATPSPGITVDRSASRALEVDEAAIIKSFTIVGRSSAGKDVRNAPIYAWINTINQ